MRRPPLRRGLFLTHGEDESRTALWDILVRKGLSQRHIHLPQLDDMINLMGDGGSRKRPGPRRLSTRTIEDTDWHNDYAQFMLDVQERLQKAEDDKKRQTLLRRLRRALKR